MDILKEIVTRNNVMIIKQSEQQGQVNQLHLLSMNPRINQKALFGDRNGSKILEGCLDRV